MKILQCVPSMAGGGAERQLTYLAAELHRLGVETHVAVGARGPNWNRLLASGATVHELRRRGPHDPRLFWDLLRVIRSVGPDIVQVWLRQMDLLGGLAALVSRKPFILAERSSEGAYPRSLKHALRLRMGGWADAIVSNSESGDRYWRTRSSRHIPRYVVPNAVPIEEIVHVLPHQDVAYGHKRVVLFAGRLEPEKNIETLLEAVALALMEEDFYFVCCGVGTLQARVSGWIARNRLECRAKLMGYTPTLWGLMKRAALVVSPSVFEGSPNVVLEAMACRCPLVVSAIAEHSALLDEESAVFAPPDSAARVAAAIVQSLRNEGAARQRAEAAFARVQRFAPAVIARQYLDVYQHVLAREAGENPSRRQRTCAES